MNITKIIVMESEAVPMEIEWEMAPTVEERAIIRAAYYANKHKELQGTSLV